MKLQRLILFVLVLHSTIYIWADSNVRYSIEGSLHDTSGQSINYATVTLLSAIDSTYIGGSITNEDGKFKINNLSSGRYTLQITHLLFKRKHVDVVIKDNMALSPIVLEENINELGAVIVTANAIQHKPDRYIISLQGNPIVKGNNTTEVLGLMPGITNERGVFKLNGRDVSQIYIDGRKIRDRKELDAIQADNIDKIEIIYLSGSEEDAGSTGGIIDIKLKKLVNGGYYGSVSGDYALLLTEGHYSDNINASVNYAYKRLSVYNYLSYNDFKQTDTYEISSIYKQLEQNITMRTQERGWKQSFSDRLSLSYELNKMHSIGINGRLSIADATPIQHSSSIVKNSNETTTNSTGSDINNDTKNRQYQLALNYNWQIDSKGSNFKLIADYLNFSNQIQQNSIYRYGINTESETNKYSKNDIDNKTDMYEVDARFAIMIGKKGQLDFGANYSLNKSDQQLDYQHLINNAWIADTDLCDNYMLEGIKYAGYMSYSSAIGKKIKYKAGYRIQQNKISYHSKKIYETNLRTYFGFYPSLSLMYNINPQDGTYINLNYQRDMDPIPYNAISPVIVYNNENSYTKGNVNIKPVNFHIIMLGTAYKSKWNLNYLFVSGNDLLYYKTFVDEKNPLVTYTMPVNNGRMYGHSFATDRTFKISQWWSIKGNLRLEWMRYKGLEINTAAWKPYVLLTNTFNTLSGWGGNLTAYLEPTYKSQERTYKAVYGLYGKVYKYLLKEKLLASLNFTALARNRQIIIDTPDVLSKKRYLTSQTGISIGITYNFNGGKKVTTKQVQSIQKYYEYKDK